MDAEALARQLADGRAHSGEALAKAFGVTRAAVWKQVAKLEAWGLEVEALAGRGYRLSTPLDLLDRAEIERRLARAGGANVARLDLLWEHESTNSYLLERPPAPGAAHVCIAEYQRAGRGRRGRSWTAPLGSGLCLSFAWQFAAVPPNLSALTLAIGVAARRAIRATAGCEPELKWPNDLIFDGRKLGGILVELSVEAHGAARVVAGIGINVSMPPALLDAVASWPQGAIDLAAATGSAPPPRVDLAAALIVELAALFAAFERDGFAPYRDEWTAADFLRDRSVRVDDGREGTAGIARGIDADGSLLVELDDGLRRVLSGDVSVRPQ